MLINQDLTSFLGELIDGNDYERKEAILSDLLRHVSFHQIHCLLVQFVVSYSSDSLNKQTMQLIHILIQKRFESNDTERNSERNHFSIVDLLHQKADQGTNIA